MPVTSGATAEVLLGGNVKKFTKAMNTAIKASQRMANKLKQHQAGIQKAAVVGAVALGAQILFIKKVTEAAAKQELAEKKLADAVLKKTGATLADVEALKAQAVALQQVTKFGDEQIMELQGLLATYGVSTDKIAEATEATLDMASALGMDLNAAAQIVGKSVGGGMVSALSRYGIIIDTKTIPKTEQAAAALAKMNEMFGGRAADEVKTYSGRLQQLKNITGDLYEEIGFALIPIIMRLLAVIKPIIVRTISWVNQNRKLVAILTGVGVGGAGLLFAVSSLGLLLMGLPAILGLLSNPITLLILGLMGIAAALIAIGLAGKTVIPDTMEEIEKRMSTVSDELRTATEELGGLREEAEKLKKSSRGGLLGPLGLEATRAEAKVADLRRELRLLALERVKLLEEARKMTPEELAFVYTGVAPEPPVPVQPELFLEEETDALKDQEEALGKLHEAWEKQKDVRQGVHDEHMLQQEEQIQMIIDNAAQQGQAAANFANSWADAFSFISQTEKDFAVAFGKALILALFKVFKGVIKSYIAEISATVLLEKGKALIKSPLTFGASLFAIAPIVAFGTLAIAGLNALQSQFVGTFETGTPFVPETGLAMVHKGERIIPAGEVGGGDVIINWNNYGPISREIDLERALRQLGDYVRNATYRG